MILLKYTDLAMNFKVDIDGTTLICVRSSGIKKLILDVIRYFEGQIGLKA